MQKKPVIFLLFLNENIFYLVTFYKADDLDLQDPFALARTFPELTTANDSNSNQGLKRKSDDIPSFDDDSSMPKVRIKVMKIIIN